MLKPSVGYLSDLNLDLAVKRYVSWNSKRYIKGKGLGVRSRVL